MKRAIKLLLIYIGFQILFMLPVMIILFVRMMPVNDPAEVSLDYNLIAISTILSALAMGWYLLAKKYVSVRDRNFSFPPIKEMPLYLIFTLAIIVIFDWLLSHFSIPDYMGETFQGLSKETTGVISVALVGPILEELLFRGAIQGHLMKIYKSPVTAIVVSALIFGIIHFNPVQILFGFFMGLILGYIYYRTKSLIPVIFIHVLNNSISTIMTNLYPDTDTLLDLLGKSNGIILLCISIIIVFLSFFIFNKMYSSKEVTQQ